MKYKVNQMVWFVDADLNIFPSLVTGASLNRDALPIYNIVKIEAIYFGDGGHPTSMTLSKDWPRGGTAEADLFETKEAAEEYVAEILQMSADIGDLSASPLHGM
jgi:hypothetical protein